MVASPVVESNPTSKRIRSRADNSRKISWYSADAPLFSSSAFTSPLIRRQSDNISPKRAKRRAERHIRSLPEVQNTKNGSEDGKETRRR